MTATDLGKERMLYFFSLRGNYVETFTIIVEKYVPLIKETFGFREVVNLYFWENKSVNVNI